jgi:hypothetical protein
VQPLKKNARKIPSIKHPDKITFFFFFNFITFDELIKSRIHQVLGVKFYVLG